MSAAANLAGHEALARIERGLRMLTVPLPHLAGLAAAVRVSLDERLPTMGVFASGRLLVNPQFAARLDERELVFVLAHELLHLALRTHDRAKGADRMEFNYAHDYIINDMLRAELGFTAIPAGGLDMPGARERSAEEIVLDMRRKGERVPSRTQVFEGKAISARRLFGAGTGRGGGSERGGRARAAEEAGDVLDDRTEREWFPGAADDQAGEVRRTEALAARALALGRAIGAMKGRGSDAGTSEQTVAALRGLYRTPWETALQKWLESVAPGERTFLRPSRRGAPRADVVLAGRKRQSWRINVVLDTSGSMSDDLPGVLGAIADGCNALAIDSVRLVQCDAVVTSDRELTPDALGAHVVSGYGGSDLGPAMTLLAEDPLVTAAVVITDGDIAYPPAAMPYDVLWVLTGPGNTGFRPPYGRLIALRGGVRT